MKALKIILISIFVILILAVGGLFIFLKTFDLNKYTPQITDQIKKATGRDVALGQADLSLSFRGIELVVKNMTVSDNSSFSSNPFLTADKLAIGLDVKPLIFQRKVALTHVDLVAPKITVIRNKEGLINAAAMAPATAAEGPATAEQKPAESAKGGQPALPPLLVNEMNLTGASVTYIDEMFEPKLAVTVDQLNVAVRNFSLTEAFDVAVKVALFSRDQNVLAKGQVKLNMNDLSATISNLNIKADLSKISAAKLNDALPMAKPAGLKDPMKGSFEVVLNSMVAGAKGLSSLNGTADLNQGYFVSELVPLPIENVSLKADLNENKIDVKTINATFAGGVIGGQAVIANYLTKPDMQFTADAQNIEVVKIVQAYKLPVSAQGKAFASLEGKATGKTPEEITSSLDVAVKAHLTEAKLDNTNLLKAGIGSIPLLPDLWNVILPTLPQETQTEAQKEVTLIEQCNVDAHMNGMVLNVQKAELKTRDLSVVAKGTVNVPQTVDLKADFYIEKNLSDNLIAKVKDLQALRESDGRVYIPVLVRGPMMKPQTMPDTQYLSQKIMKQKGKEELQKVLDKNPQAQGIFNSIFGQPAQEKTEGQPSQNEEQQKQEPKENGVDSIFKLFEKK